MSDDVATQRGNARRRQAFMARNRQRRRVIMPRGAYTEKQDRKAEHIEEGYEKRGVSKKEAERRAWATVNKQDKGGKNSGSGRSSSRSAAAKKGWETRRRRGNG
jgi:plasmid stabilization system protein ParE